MGLINLFGKTTTPQVVKAVVQTAIELEDEQVLQDPGLWKANALATKALAHPTVYPVQLVEFEAPAMNHYLAREKLPLDVDGKTPLRHIDIHSEDIDQLPLRDEG